MPGRLTPGCETAMPEPQIHIVEDDQSIREMLRAVLIGHGYNVVTHDSGEAALNDTTTRVADLVILDVGLPGIDGLTVCSELRRAGRAEPILMLTARHSVTDRVEGLDSGADDYLVKPFALEELLARVRAMLRRDTRPAGTSDDAKLALGDLTVDVHTRQVTRAGQQIVLTKLEFDLLHLLVRNSPNVLPRDTIIERVWGYEPGSGSNSLEVFVSQLRRKLEGVHPERLIHTTRGVGYCARADQ